LFFIEGDIKFEAANIEETNSNEEAVDGQDLNVFIFIFFPLESLQNFFSLKRSDGSFC